MLLRNQVEWALHCCAVLAGLAKNERVSTKALAEFHGVPKEYLSKALQSLSQAGLVNGTLGPSGGYCLSRPPAQISFLDIVEAVEGKTSTFKCTEIRNNNPCLPKGHCNTGACAVARVMWAADEAWRDRLRRTSLADLGAMLEKDVPAALLQKGRDWLLAR